MSEARKRQQYEMSGVAVGMILKPSKGIRDDILRLGLKPKNHIKENMKSLKKIEKENKERKSLLEAQSPKPFKLKAFENIESKIKINKQNTAPSTPKRESTPVKKNYISINAKKAKSAPSSRAPSVAQTPIPSKEKLGVLPKYLIQRKLEWAKREQDRLIAIQQEKAPKGQTLLPDQARMRTLNALRSQKDELEREIQSLPLVIELQSLKKRKQDMEAKLRETENGIELFSRSRVYVNTSDFEKMCISEAA